MGRQFIDRPFHISRRTLERLDFVHDAVHAPHQRLIRCRLAEINAGASVPAHFSTGYHYVSLGLNVQTTAAIMNNGRVWFQMEM